MSDRSQITWRIGSDNYVHAITGADPLATAWVTLCGRLVSGDVDCFPKCPECIEYERTRTNTTGG